MHGPRRGILVPASMCIHIALAATLSLMPLWAFPSLSHCFFAVLRAHQSQPSRTDMASTSRYNLLQRLGRACGQADLPGLSEFASVEHRLLYSWYPPESCVARALLRGGALGDWPDYPFSSHPKGSGVDALFTLQEARHPEVLHDFLSDMAEQWRGPAESGKRNMVGAIAKLVAGESKQAAKLRRRFGIAGTLRDLSLTYVDMWTLLSTGFCRKYALPGHPEFRKVLLRRVDGKLPLLVEDAGKAKKSFWAASISRQRMLGNNACGVFLSKMRAALLWKAAQTSQRVADALLASEAEALYLAGLGVNLDAEHGLSHTPRCPELSRLDSPIPQRNDMLKYFEKSQLLGFGSAERSLAPCESDRPVVRFRGRSRLPDALLSNFAFVPWGA